MGLLAAWKGFGQWNGLLAAWRGFGQWNGQWNPIVRTTGASGPLGCMERVWAMESHIKKRVMPPPTQCFPLFPGRTGPGNRVRGSGSKPLKLAAV